MFVKAVILLLLI